MQPSAVALRRARRDLVRIARATFPRSAFPPDVAQPVISSPERGARLPAA